MVDHLFTAGFEIAGIHRWLVSAVWLRSVLRVWIGVGVGEEGYTIGGSAKIIAAASELSNTDIGGNLVGLIESSIAIRAGATVLKTADEMFDELLQLGRR